MHDPTSGHNLTPCIAQASMLFAPCFVFHTVHMCTASRSCTSFVIARASPFCDTKNLFDRVAQSVTVFRHNIATFSFNAQLSRIA